MTAERRILGLKPETFFQVFKYSIYTLIFFNLVYFMREEYLASAARFPDGVGFGMLIDAFSQSTDSFAWLVLLLAFELETYVIPDHKLKGPLKWGLNLVAAVCYILITQALIGYINHFEVMTSFVPHTVDSACAAVGSVASYAVDLYEFVDLSASNCANFAATDLLIQPELGAITDAATFEFIERNALTDVINASTWLLVVVVLWIDVFLQLRGELTAKLYKWNGAVKAVLYLTLFCCCLFWAWLGDFMGFWDALLWILAFFFIEMNLFKWHEEEELAAEVNQ